MGSRRCQSRGLCRAQCVRRAKPGEARSMDSSTTALIGSSAFHGVLSFDVFLETTALVPFAVRGLGVVVLDHDEHARVEDCARPEFSCVGASWFLSVELDDAPRSVALQRFRGSREGERGVCECLRSAPNTRARCCVKPQAQRAVSVAPKGSASVAKNGPPGRDNRAAATRPTQRTSSPETAQGQHRVRHVEPEASEGRTKKHPPG